MSIPEHGWHIERDAIDHEILPHRLRIDGMITTHLTTEQADAFPTAPEPEVLPDGIRAGYLLDAHANCPDGWERRFTDGWAASTNISFVPVEARRIPEPDPPITIMLIPWYNAVGWKCTCGEIISRVYDDIEGGPIVVCSGGDHPFVDSDGNVVVAAL
jgi:hypothetical protein